MKALLFRSRVASARAARSCDLRSRICNAWEMPSIMRQAAMAWGSHRNKGMIAEVVTAFSMLPILYAGKIGRFQTQSVLRTAGAAHGSFLPAKLYRLPQEPPCAAPHQGPAGVDALVSGGAGGADGASGGALL